MRLFPNLTAVFAALALGGNALAFEPDSPECVAPARPGGGFDLTCRIAAEGLEKAGQLPEPMQVTFMPGGIGAVAYNHFNTTRRDDPDAIVAFSGGSLLNLAQGKFGEFDENAVRWLATAGADYGAVVVKADAPWQDLGELMAAIEADPQSVVVGAGGTVGSQDWMKAALLMRAVGVDPREMRYVAYEGGGESITALLGGHIQLYTGDVSEMSGRLEDGTMRVLAVLAPERLPEPWQDHPTATEQGYPVVWDIIRGYYMGPDVSDEAYAAWTQLFRNAYETEAYQQVRADKGLYPFQLAGEDLDSYVKERVAQLREVAREAGLIE